MRAGWLGSARRFGLACRLQWLIDFARCTSFERQPEVTCFIVNMHNAMSHPLEICISVPSHWTMSRSSISTSQAIHSLS